MNEHGPLLRDLISTADHPIGNIPPESRLRDLVGTAPAAGVNLTHRVPTDTPPAYRVGEYTDEVDLDGFFDSDEGKALIDWFRIRELIDWHVDTTLEYIVEHPEVYANHEHYEVAS